MSDYGTEITTPVGRIVWGHPGNAQDKTDQQTRQVIRNAQGETIKQWAFGLAIPKDQIGALYAAMQAEAAKGYPQGTPSNFSWKLKDGDGVDREGKSYAAREGWAGCWVLTISSEFKAPPLYVWQNGAYMQLQPDQIKTGDFVQCGLNLKVNVPANRQHTPGLYINPLSVLLMFEGDEIKTGYQADPNALFGQQPQSAAMPAGARPIGAPAPGQAPPAGTGMPGMGNAPPMPGAPAAGPSSVAASPAAASPPPPPPAGPQRPTDPSHIHAAGTPQEQWFINGAWTPAVAAPAAPTMPPPAQDFIPGGPAPMPQPSGMPGMPPPR